MSEAIMKAQRAQERGMFAEALTYYHEELSANPHNAVAYQGAALCHYKLGNLQEAVNVSKKSLSIDNSLSLPHVILAEVYDSWNEIEKSRMEVFEAYQLDSKSEDVLGAYGAFLLMDHRVDDAITILEQALQINPDLYNVHNNLTVAYSQKRDFGKVYVHVREMNRLRPSIRNSVQLTIAYLNSKKLFKVVSILFILFAVSSYLFRTWYLLTVPLLIALLLIIADIILARSQAQK